MTTGRFRRELNRSLYERRGWSPVISIERIAIDRMSPKWQRKHTLLGLVHGGIRGFTMKLISAFGLER